MTDTAPPPFEAPSMEGYSPDNAQDIFKAPDTGSDTSSTPSQSVEDQGAKAIEEIADIPKEEAKSSKKSSLDKIGSLKTPEKRPEPKAEEPIKQEERLTGKEGKNNSENVRALREAKSKLESLEPEYEKVKQEYHATKEELAKLKAMGLSDEERKEFTRYREMHAVEATKASEEFQKNVMEPINMRLQALTTVMEKANLTPEAKEALVTAIDIEDPWDRNKAIRGIFQGADLDTDEYQEAVKWATDIAKDLNENLYPRHDQILANAHEIQLAARHKDQQAMQEMTKAQQAEMKKHMDDVYGHMTGSILKPLMDDTDLSIEGVRLGDALKGASVPDNPQDMAVATQMLAAAPFLVQKLNKLLEENAQLKEANRIRNGAAPSRSDGLAKTIEGGTNQLTADDVFKSRR